MKSYHRDGEDQRMRVAGQTINPYPLPRRELVKDRFSQFELAVKHFAWKVTPDKSMLDLSFSKNEAQLREIFNDKRGSITTATKLILRETLR